MDFHTFTTRILSDKLTGLDYNEKKRMQIHFYLISNCPVL